MIARAHEGNLEVPKADLRNRSDGIAARSLPRYQERTPAYIVRLQSAVSLRDRARGLVSPTFCDGVHLRAQPINCQNPERIKNALSRVPKTV